MLNWIKTEDRLPDHDGSGEGLECWIFVKDDIIPVFWRQGEELRWYDSELGPIVYWNVNDPSHWIQRLPPLPPAQSLTERVLCFVEENLSSNEFNLIAMSQHVCKTPRTLQRELKKEGTSYIKIVEQVKYRISIDLLRDHSINIETISYDLGFSETSGFIHAFKRWSGTTPGKYRKTNPTY